MRIAQWFFENVRFQWLLPLLVWCIVIFLLSEMPGSGKNIVPSLWYVLERKSAHVFEYAVLAFFSFRFFAAVYPHERFSRVAILSGAFALAYGALDEFHQSFVFGRGARLSDVMIDGIGISISLVLIFLYQVRNRERECNLIYLESDK